MSDALPAPCRFDPHAADPTCIGARPIKEAVCRPDDAVTLAREEHHMPAGFGD
jgi:hypothetical protein